MLLKFALLFLFNFCYLHSEDNSVKASDTPYPCKNNPIFIAYDKSSGLKEKEFDKETEFLSDILFPKWTNFGSLTLLAYGSVDSQQQSINPNDVTGKPSMCSVFNILQPLFFNLPNIIWFISDFNVTDTELCMDQEYNAHSNFLTFVVMKPEIRVDNVRKIFPQAQIIKWNISNDKELMPSNWEWTFWTSYGCNEDDDNSAFYPCNKRILVGFDVSSQMGANIKTLKDFLINNVFTQHWNNFKNLAIMGYSSEMHIKNFGNMSSLSSIHDFINNIPEETNYTSVSLCEVFSTLTTMYLRDMNIILFVNSFHDQIEDECLLWMKRIRENVNSIKFIKLNESVNEDYLLTHFPQAKFIPWNIEKEDGPNDFQSQFFYGCDEYTTKVGIYPCDQSLNYIIFEKSNHLSPIVYGQLINFLLIRIFINKWTNFHHVVLGTIYLYPHENGESDVVYLISAKTYIRQQLRANKKSQICYTFNDASPGSNENLIIFLSQFDEKIVNSTDGCLNNIQYINKHVQNLVLIALTSLVDKVYMAKVFSNAKIVSWNTENENEPIENWAQIFWEAFNCSGLSPIIKLPETTTTAKLSTTTPLLTSTAPSSTKQSTLHDQTTLKISTPISTTSRYSTTLKHSNQQDKTKILLGVFIPLIILFLLISVVGIWWCRRKNREKLINVLAAKETKGIDNKYENEPEDPWEASFEYLQINFLDKLGSGEFGDVYLGRINGDAPIKNIYSNSPQCQRFQNCEVAVKTLPALMQVDEWAKKEFYKEVEFMKTLKFNQNVVCFLGYVNDFANPLMLLEYCANGDLLKFIKANKQKFVDNFEEQTGSDCKTLLSFSWQISSGLEYLGSLNLIHRDIAARNVLLDKNNTCKISDFGLCRNSVNQLYQSSGGKLPIKWMAIESLKENIFSTKTDVWSYGVLLWELFTLGNLPYVGVENVFVFIESEKRLNKPTYCTDQVYEIMLDCWLVDPEDRPTFTIICQLFAKMLETSTLHYNYTWIEEANQIDEI